MNLLSVGACTSINTNVFSNGVFNNFKVSPNYEDVSLGFYKQGISTERAITEQSWRPEIVSFPINKSYSISLGKKIDEKLSVLLTAGSRKILNITKELLKIPIQLSG